MAVTKALSSKPLSPTRQISALIAKLAPGPQKIMRGARTALRKRFPTANELVYEYARSLVISYSATERGGEAVLAISATADGVMLHLNHGPQLKDPHGLLQGKGRAMREIPLESARMLTRPEVIALINAATKLTKPALARTGKGILVLKSVASTRAPGSQKSRTTSHSPHLQEHPRCVLRTSSVSGSITTPRPRRGSMPTRSRTPR